MEGRRAGSFHRLLAVAAAIVAVDLLWDLLVGSTGTVFYGLVDEPAHLATCALALAVLAVFSHSPPPRRFVAAALIGSVAIDFDHLPGYLGWHLLTGSLPRPYTHSLLTVAVLLMIARALRGGSRQIALGLSFGIGTHLLRDLATGPGVSLFWPLDANSITIPYLSYAATLIAAPVAISLRARRDSARRRPSASSLPSADQPGGS